MNKEIGYVYILMNGKEVVYVGQAKDVESRVAQHFKDKQFDSYYVEEVPKKFINEYESHFIVCNNPKYNQTLPPNNLFMTALKIGKMFNMTEKNVKNVMRQNRLKYAYNNAYHVTDEVAHLILENSPKYCDLPKPKKKSINNFIKRPNYEFIPFQ